MVQRPDSIVMLLRVAHQIGLISEVRHLKVFSRNFDELRFATVRRTDGWLRTEFNNQSNPSGFYSLSAEELISDGRLLPTVVLTDSDVETYEEENPTRENQNNLPVEMMLSGFCTPKIIMRAVNTNYCLEWFMKMDRCLILIQIIQDSSQMSPIAPVLTVHLIMKERLRPPLGLSFQLMMNLEMMWLIKFKYRQM